jgi:hypothetical protein
MDEGSGVACSVIHIDGGALSVLLGGISVLNGAG